MSERRRLALVIAYDGTDFAGWQTQPSTRTVQGEIEAVVASLTGRAAHVLSAGRTDAGVHAEAQVAHVDIAPEWSEDCRHMRHRLNALLAKDVRIRAAAVVPDGRGDRGGREGGRDGPERGREFHARKSARAKRYRYGFHVAPVGSPFALRYRLHVAHALDMAAMREAARHFEGEHDFASLQTSGSSVLTSVREVRSCEIRGEAPEVSLVIEGSGFLRHMVRAIAGSILLVGRGRRKPGWIREMLAARERAVAGPNVPAHGLTLERVRYSPEVEETLDTTLEEQGRFEPGEAE